MKEVFSEKDPTFVELMRQELEAEGIECFIRNENTNTAMAAFPLPLFWPTLCIVDDAKFEAAKLIVARFEASRKEVAEGEEVCCPKCGEANPSQFASCWNCQSEL